MIFFPASTRHRHPSSAGSHSASWSLPHGNPPGYDSCCLQRSLPSAQSLRDVIEFRSRAPFGIFERVSNPGRTKSYVPD